MNRLEEEIKRLEQSKELFSSIQNLISDKKIFEKLSDYENHKKLENQVSELTKQINVSLDSNKATLEKIKNRVALYKKLIFSLSFIGSISIFFLHFFEYYDISIILVSILIVFFLLLSLAQNAVIKFRNLIIYVIISSLLFLIYLLFPSTKQFIDNNSSTFTFLSFMFSLVLSVSTIRSSK